MRTQSYVAPGSKTLSEKEIAALTFADIRVHHYTGQAFIKSGQGRDAVYGYRHGLKTNVGDLDPAVWLEAANSIIEREGETELLQYLIEWEQETVPYFYKTKQELVQRATEMHVARLFDNPEWVDFVRFNQRYRPEVLERVELVSIRTSCCGEARTTQAILDRWGTETTPCPCCGKHSPYRKVAG